MAEEQDNHSYSEEFAEAIARPAGDFDSAEQDNRIKRKDADAAHESILLGNHRENKIVMGHAAGQVTEGALCALSPALAGQASGADRNEGLFDIIGLLVLL